MLLRRARSRNDANRLIRGKRAEHESGIPDHSLFVGIILPNL